MATNLADLQQEEDGRHKDQFETPSDSVSAVRHYRQSNRVIQFDPPPPPPPPPPSQSLILTSTFISTGSQGRGPVHQRRAQKELQFELVQAIERDNLSAVQYLISEGTQLNCIIMFNKTPLTYAIEKESFVLAKVLVKSGANTNYREPYGNAQQPLHIAVNVHSCDMMEFLLDNGADINGRNGCGLTPLMLASYTGQLEAVQLLHSREADLNIRDHVGKTAVHRAAEGQHSFVLQFLLTKGADINALDRFGRTALYHSIMFRHMDMIKLLLESGVSVNGSDLFSQSPLQVAVHRLSRQNMRAVLSTSLDYHKREKRIPTAEVRMLLNSGESEATVRVDFEILQLLVNAGALLDFFKLGDYFENLPNHVHDDDLKIALWHFLVVCDCTSDHEYFSLMGSKMSASVLDTWRQEKKSLQQLCRTAVRNQLRRRKPCDIHDSVNKLPVPTPLKNFLNLSDFFKRYPQFPPLFTAVGC
ncbi:uncharacterized protein LOC143276189 [Babylonia areolata]